MDFVCAKCGGNASQIVSGIDGRLYTQCVQCSALTPSKKTYEPEKSRIGRSGRSDVELSWSLARMRLPDSEISRAERNIQEARRRIARQRAIIDGMGGDGHETRDAKRLLQTMLETLRAYEGDRRALEDEGFRDR